MAIEEHFGVDFDPEADEFATVRGPGVRVTVLTSRLVRVEYDPDETFDDRPTQMVWYRNLPVPSFDVERTDGSLVVATEDLRLEYEHGVEERLTPETLSIELADGTVWTYGDAPESNLGGALRTVDQVDGAADLEDGLVSRDGWTVVDDTDNLVFGDDGWITPRGAHDRYEDLYFFGYGADYEACLRDFTDLSGEVPLLPRWALGNWWSRYWEYTQDELRTVVETFRDQGIPLSVCMVDMDWHTVENPHHDGWTGWTWNEEYFPDPKGFVDWLHDNDVRVSLNLHPAEGVHPHEDQYEEVAQHVGVDPDTEQPVEFDASDPEFLEAYFEHLIHPMEDEEGVDFWWIDWQQWEESPGMEGLDPLWMLNHLHSLDRTRDGRRPFILSRWSGLGGHRYPAGFSGDARISWDSLRFQPPLTATSANVGYGWWSHDIGGHDGGTGDPREFGELYARWTQFGVFSPINRIHTTKHRFVDKRPWQYNPEVRQALGRALRLRHALIPYTYTMAWRNHSRSVPLVRPMYFHDPDAEPAYHTPHQYYFGSELVVAPHLRERDEDTNLARRSVWLPDGEWFDFFSGAHYDGGFHVRYGGLDDVPVYAKAGAIVPMAADGEWNETDNPETLRVVAFPSADNSFELYEDDGVSLDYRDGAQARTRLAQEVDDETLAFEIGATEGDLTHVPIERDWELHFRGVTDEVTVEVATEEYVADVTYEEEDTTLVVCLDSVPVTEDVRITVEAPNGPLVAREDRTAEVVETLLWNFTMPAVAKADLLDAFEADAVDWIRDYRRVLTTSQCRALAESVTGAGVDHLDHDGEERIVVWNDDDRNDVTYQFSSWDWGSVPHLMGGESDHGVLPTFAVFDASESDEAAVTLNYDDLVSVTCKVPRDGE